MGTFPILDYGGPTYPFYRHASPVTPQHSMDEDLEKSMTTRFPAMRKLSKMERDERRKGKGD